MSSLAVCRCLFRLMRHCFLGRWICLPVSERFRLVWKCHLFDYSIYIQFCVHWHGGQCLRRLVPNYVVVFRLGCVYSPVSLYFYLIHIICTQCCVMLRAILNKSWQQHPTRHQLYGHLPPITKTIQVRRTRHAGHCWRSRDELIRDVLLWIPTHGRAKAGRPARTYIQQLCEDTGCCPEDLPRAMNDREEWRERVRDIRAASTIWWWWWWWCMVWSIFI